MNGNHLKRHKPWGLLFIPFLMGCTILKSNAAEPERVWLDVDCSAGIFTKDVDDALALVQAFRSPELDIQGISVVYGNAPLESCLPITRDLTEAYAPRPIEVWPGAAGPEDLGEITEAHRAMVAALEEGPLTLFALGPVTTVGTLLRLRPDLASRINRIVLVAGRRPGQHFKTGTRDRAPLSDFNFERDPEAMRILLEAPVELVLAPWEVSSQVWVHEVDLDRLAESGGSGAWIAEKSRPWLLIWKRVFKADGFNPFDTLAIGYTTHPEFFDLFEGNARIENHPDDVAAYRFPESDVPLKPYLHVTPWEEEGRRVTYIHGVRSHLFKDVLMARLMGGATNIEARPE